MVFFVLFFQLISDQLSGSANMPFAVIIIINFIITIVIIVSVSIGNNAFKVSACMICQGEIKMTHLNIFI